MTLSDYLRAELVCLLERLTPDEVREGLARLEPARVRESPAEVHSSAARPRLIVIDAPVVGGAAALSPLETKRARS
jgi:hypothetical protein